MQNCSITNNVSASLIRVSDIPEQSLVTNSCFYGNDNIIVHGLEEGFGIQNENNANGDPCDIFQNIFLDPLYNDQSDGDYTLQIQSPNIDAGVPDSLFDPDGTVGDIGAFYFHQNDVVEDGVWHGAIPQQSWMIYPNPCNSSFRIFSNDEQITSFALYDIQGRLVDHIICNGSSTFTYNASLLCSGTYFIQLFGRSQNLGNRPVFILK